MTPDTSWGGCRMATIFRVVYLAMRPEAVYVLHCFQKKSRKTSRTDLELAQKRFRAILQR